MARHPILFSILIVGVLVIGLGLAFAALIGQVASGGKTFYGSGDIAVVKLEGPIFDSHEILERFQEIKDDKRIKAVVFRVDSPGGAIAPSQEIFSELLKLKETKKIVVSMGSLAASGGYYVSCPAHKIIASPGTITGSIGVIMENFNVQELLKWAKLENRVIKKGEYKDVASPFRTMTEEEKAYLQSIVDNMYNQFTAVVAQQRGIPAEKIKDVAEGRIFTGEQALQIGLIDGLGTVYDAIEEAKKLANLPSDAKVIWPNEDEGPFKLLAKTRESMGMFSRLIEGGLTVNPMPLWMYSPGIGQ